MDIGSRIKKLRKELDLTQSEFASRIGSVQNTVTGYESGRRNPSAPVISLICRAFNVREEWLKDGSGEMFKAEPSAALDVLAAEYKLDHSDYVFLEKLLKNRKLLSALEDFCIDTSQALLADDVPAGTKAFSNSDLEKLSIDEKVELYRRELEREEKAAANSEVS